MTEEVLSRAARGLFDKIANTLINNNDPLAASGRQDHIRQCQCHNSHTYFNSAHFYCDTTVTVFFVTIYNCDNLIYVTTVTLMSQTYKCDKVQNVTILNCDITLFDMW